MHISTEQFKSALSAEGVLKARDLDLLRVHYGCRGCRATASQLGQLLGYQAVIVVNGVFGRLGHRVADFLKITQSLRPNDNFQWWTILAYGINEERGFVWILKDELVSALAELGLLEDASSCFAEEITDFYDLFEGAVREIRVNAYERNPTARALCIQHYGSICAICKFDFGTTYGEIGRGFIHVHHLLELSQIGREYCVDPVADLRPVCPNCHAMLHRRRPAYSIEEVRDRLAETRANHEL